jgi:hypothetical protein
MAQLQEVGLRSAARVESGSRRGAKFACGNEHLKSSPLAVDRKPCPHGCPLPNPPPPCRGGNRKGEIRGMRPRSRAGSGMRSED